jgi:hypothetical protein
MPTSYGKRGETLKDLEVQLQALRPLLLAENGKSFLAFFDEFIEQREFGPALHAVCDFLFESESIRGTQSILDQIERLHAVMGIDDRCVEDIGRRANDSV